MRVLHGPAEFRSAFHSLNHLAAWCWAYAGTQRVEQPRLIGRDEELAVVSGFLDGLSHGPRALLIEGEAGIGKTALWRAAVDEAPRRGCRVLTCVGAQGEARLSFVGLNDLVGDVVDEAIGALPRPQREAVERALVRRGGEADRLPDARTIGIGVHSLIVELARAEPVLIAVDDVQWLDGATARSLTFVARRLEGHRVGLMVAERAPASSPDPLALERALDPSRVSRLRLGPLDQAAIRELVEVNLGHGYPRPVLLRIVEASGGNPLFALEIARALGRSPLLEPGTPLTVPETLRELVRTRVAGIPVEGRDALLAAAALSRPTGALVEQAASAEGLAVAEEAALLRVESERVVFAHPLYASAVYSDAASGRRLELHKRLADLVADPEERARHLALGTLPPDEQVATKLEDAATAARARAAWDAGGELLELARDFTAPTDPEVRRQRTVQAAEYHIHAGDRPRARGLLEPVLEEAPPGPLRSTALRLMAEIRYNEESFGAVVELLEEALGQVDDPALQSTIEQTLTYVLTNAELDFLAADEHATRALDHAMCVEEGAVLGEALAVRAMVDFLFGRGVDWDAVAQAVALEDTSRVMPVQMRPSYIAASLKLYVGRFAEARQGLNALRQVASDTGDESDLGNLLMWLACLETLNGDFDRGLALSEEAVVEGRLSGGELNRVFGLSQRALANAHRGLVDETRSDAAQVAAFCTQGVHTQPLLFTSTALALLELSLGDPAAAWAATEPMVERVEAIGIGEPVPYRFLPCAIDALVALGELDRAERLLDMFETRARELDRSWALATGARSRALLLAARGDLDGADQAVEQAMVEHARMEMPFELARTLLVQGGVRRRRRERRAARESLEKARQIFDELGARLWAERSRAELARLGRRRAAGELTAAEQRAAELAAEGKSNKEIAAALFVSVHTVELHLSSAYAKLGVHSRAQLAHRLREQ